MIECAQDGEQHTLFIVENVVIPEAQNAEALRSQMRVASSVARAFSVLTAIGFDDESMGQTGEIDNVAIDRRLALEFVSGEPLGPENLPQAMFWGSLR